MTWVCNSFALKSTYFQAKQLMNQLLALQEVVVNARCGAGSTRWICQNLFLTHHLWEGTRSIDGNPLAKIIMRISIIFSFALTYSPAAANSMPLDDIFTL
jgi:hypothetical protein